MTGFDKELAAVTANGGGAYTLTYELAVTRTGDGPAYELVDELLFGDAVTVDGDPAVTAPGGVTPNPDYDGVTDTLVAGPVDIADGATHVYTVTVEVTVDAAAATFDSSDCDPTAGEGTGFSNQAAVTSNGSTVTDETCETFPLLDIDKEVASGPTPLGDGRFEVVYTLTARNEGAGDGAYDLTDELRFGDGITIVDQSVANDVPGTIVTNGAWDGVGDTGVVTGEPIAGAVDAATPTTHVYTVTVEVEVEVPGDLTPEAADCTIEPGEAGSGLLNEASISGESSTVTDDDCVGPPLTLIDKDLADIAPLGGNRYELVYELTATRVSGGPGTYLLSDDLLLGEALSVESVTAANLVPGTVPLNQAFDGDSDTQVVDAPVAIDDGETHTYEVRVAVTVDAAAVTPASSDCSLDPGEPGTGAMNRATLDADGVESEAEDCQEFPSITPIKTVTSGPTPAGGGEYDISYRITVLNSGSGDGTYDLADDLRFGDGIEIVSQSIANTAPGTITPNPDWDGVDDLVVVEGEPIAGAGADATVHTYEVDVRVRVDGGLTAEAADCSLDPDDSGTGLLNEARVSVDGDTQAVEDCAQLPVTTPTKTLASVVENGDGTHTLTYALSVTRQGEGPGYRLTDALRYGDAVTVESVSVTDSPAAATVNAAFDGADDTLIADGVPIADGETHTYEVEVVASVDHASVTFEGSDCEIGDGDSGSGFSNTVGVTSNDVTTTDDACEPPPGITIGKEVVSGPTLQDNGTYEVVYEVTATNAGAGPGSYDLEDSFAFGDGITFVFADVANTAPGGIATNPDWNGQDRPVVVAGQPIAGATADGPEVHTYAVRVVVEVADDLALEASDCTLGDGESGTGFLNHTTLTVNGEAAADQACAEAPPPEQLEIEKVVDTESAALGDTVSYTVTVTNVGTFDYTVDAPAEIVDDLSDVLDDATWIGDATASSGEISYSAPELTWTGPLAVGDSVTLTYSVRVDEDATGSGDLYNTVTSVLSNANCAPGRVGPECEAATTIRMPAPPPAPPSPITDKPIPVTG